MKKLPFLCISTMLIFSMFCESINAVYGAYSGPSECNWPEYIDCDSSCVAVIGKAADTVYPDETLTVTGEGLAGAALKIYAEGTVREITPLRSDNTKMQTVVPSDMPKSVMLVQPVKDGKIGKYVKVNAPVADWADTDVIYTGQENFEINIYGKNLFLEGYNPKAYLRLSNGDTIELQITAVNPYKLTALIPSISCEGSAVLYVHNGSGGKYGFSDNIEITVSQKPIKEEQELAVINAADFGALPNDDSDDYEALKNAVAYAEEKGGAIIQLQGGEYILSSGIDIPGTSQVILQGAGKGEYDRGTKTLGGGYTSITFDRKENLPMYLFRLSGSNTTLRDMTLFFGDDGNTDKSGLANTVININGSFHTIDNIRMVKDDWRDCNTTEKSSYPLGTCIFAERTSKHINITGDEFHHFGTAIVMPSVQYVYGWGWYSDEYAAEYIKIQNCKFFGYGNNTYRKNDTQTFNACMGMSFSNVHRSSVENCIFESADRENGKIMNRTLYCGGSVSNMYIAGNVIKNAGPHPSAECDGNQGEQFLFHGVGTGGSLFNIASCSGTALMLRKDNIVLNDSSGNKIDQISSMDNSGSYIHRGVSLGTKWTAYITAGKGKGQYRQIISCSEDDNTASLTLDREWNIEPDETSVILLFAPYRNITIYKNKIDNKQLLSKGMKSGGVLFFFDAIDNIVAENEFNNVVFGVAMNTSFKQPLLYNIVRDNKMSGMNEVYDGAMQGGDTTVHATFFSENGGSNAGPDGNYDNYHAWYTVGNVFRNNFCENGDVAAEQTIRPWHKKMNKNRSAEWYGEEKGQMMLIFEKNTFNNVAQGFDIGNSAHWTLSRNNNYTFTKKEGGYIQAETVFEDEEYKLRYMEIKEDKIVSDEFGTAEQYTGLYTMNGEAGVITSPCGEVCTDLTETDDEAAENEYTEINGNIVTVVSRSDDDAAVLETYEIPVTDTDNIKLSDADLDSQKIVVSINDPSGAKEGIAIISRTDGKIKYFIAPMINWGSSKLLGIDGFVLENNIVYAISSVNGIYIKIDLKGKPFIEEMASVEEASSIYTDENFVYCKGTDKTYKFKKTGMMPGNDGVYCYTFNITPYDLSADVFYKKIKDANKYFEKNTLNIPAFQLSLIRLPEKQDEEYTEEMYIWKDMKPLTKKIVLRSE